MYPVTVLLHVSGQLLVFLSDLAVLLLYKLYRCKCAYCCIIGQMYDDDDYAQHYAPR